MPNAQRKLALLRDRRTGFKQNHGTSEHEMDLYLCKLPEDFDGASIFESVPILIRIEPTPRVISKPLDTVIQGQGEGIETARLQQYEVTDISRRYSDDLLRPSYFVMALRGTVVTAERARDGFYARYRLSGTPELFEKAWKLMLVQASSPGSPNRD